MKLSTILTPVMALIAAGPAIAQETNGKVPWNRDPKAAMQEAKRKGLPMMLYFTSKG